MESEKPGLSLDRNQWVHFIAGGQVIQSSGIHCNNYIISRTGAVVSTTVTFPFDVVEIRLQSDVFHHLVPGRPGDQNQAHAGTVKLLRCAICFSLLLLCSLLNWRRTIYKHGSWRILFGRLGHNLWRIVPGTAIGFYAHKNTQRLLADTRNNGHESAAVHLYLCRSFIRYRAGNLHESALGRGDAAPAWSGRFPWSGTDG